MKSHKKIDIPSHTSGIDERRRDVRADISMVVSVDIQIALSYDRVDSTLKNEKYWQWDDLAVSPDLVKAMVNQTDLTTQEPLLLQMLTRLDWMLTTVMKTLAKEGNVPRAFPEFVTANLSGSGIRFPSKREFQAEDLLAFKIVLRPFIPIQAVGKVLRVETLDKEGESIFETACEFSDINPDDREAIIRHVIRSQAVLQRQRAFQESLVIS